MHILFVGFFSVPKEFWYQNEKKMPYQKIHPRRAQFISLKLQN